MNRIQQILSKAERDGTARRLSSIDDVTVPAPPAHRSQEKPPAPPRGRAAAVVDPPEMEPDARGDVVGYAEPPIAAPVTSTVILDPVLVAALKPFSPAAEQYRSLRGRIAQMETEQALRVIQVTSPGKGDGKTMTALNLALSMAQEFQRRILIVDADLRYPRVHELLGVEPGPGLVDVLTGTVSLEEALLEIPEHHITVLRAGRAYERPAEMLGSGPMRRLVDTLRTQFDRIVFDSAPALVADPGAVASLVDGVLMVVRASVTTKPAIARALGALTSSKLLGLVFNESASPNQGQYGASA
jgi:protein-tyrosine kinase